MARIGRYRHFLGAWDPAERVAAGGPAHTFNDAAEIADAQDGVIAAMTVPARVKRTLWEIDPSDEAAFAAYGQRVVGFFRAAGVPLKQPCATKLVAAPPGETKTSAAALVNVGESEWSITTGEATLRVPAGEACLLSPAASYTVIVPPEAEFGLLLELG